MDLSFGKRKQFLGPNLANFVCLGRSGDCVESTFESNVNNINPKSPGDLNIE